MVGGQLYLVYLTHDAQQSGGKAMEEVGYRVITVKSHDLPNGKELLRMDFEREELAGAALRR